MMNYKMIEDENGFTVFEKPTNQVINRVFKDKEAARVFLRHLNLGGGFDGWTPAFMQQKYFFDAEEKLVVTYK
jgi:hypothetical protein